MLDLWLEQESHIEKTAAQQFEELAEKIAVEGGEPGPGLEPVKPDGHKWETSNYSEELRTSEAADQLLKRELTGRVVDEVPKTDVQQTPPRAVNTVNGRAEDRVPTVEKLKKAAEKRELSPGQQAAVGGLVGGLGGLAGAAIGENMAHRAAARAARRTGTPQKIRFMGTKGRLGLAAGTAGILGLSRYLRAKRKQSRREKTAGISLSKRESLSSKQFAVPMSKARKIGVAGEVKGEAKGKYPIDTLKRARNALARVSQFGTPSERSAVRSKVYSRYPNLRAGFEERHAGQSPTAKQNIRKVEQGGVGKTASLKDAMIKVASEGKVRTLEGWAYFPNEE